MSVPTRPAHPLTFGEVMDSSVSVFMRGWTTFTALGVVGTVPTFLAGLWLDGSLSGLSQSQLLNLLTKGSGASHALAAMSLPLVLLGLVGVATGVLAGGGAVAAAGALWAGRDPTVGEALSVGVRRFWPFLAAGALSTLLAMISSVVVLIGSVVAVVYLYVQMPAVVLGGKNGWAALGESFRLVNGMWWRVFGVMLLFFLAVSILSSLLSAIPTAFSSSAGARVASAVFSAAADAILFGAPYVASVVLYEDLRLRKDGSDLLLALDGAPPA
jgi:hypothetical protein